MPLPLVTSASPGEEDLARCSASGAVTLVSSPVVVEVEVAIEGGLHGGWPGEEPSAELDAPELAEDGALKPLDKAVGPGVARFGASMPDVSLGASLVEGSPVFVALIGQDAVERPASCLESRQDAAGQEAGGGRCRELQAHLSHGER